MSNGRARLLAAHHRLSRAPIVDPEDPERLSDTWVAAHAEFHEALLNGCANQRLKSMATALRDSAELYRTWSLPLGHESAARDVATEHSHILEAAVARDAERAVELLLDHIERTTSTLLDVPVEDDVDAQQGWSGPRRSNFLITATTMCVTLTRTTMCVTPYEVRRRAVVTNPARAFENVRTIFSH